MADTKLSSSRDERLAARLRENLKRRKVQARALGEAGSSTDSGAESAEVESPAESAPSQESGLSKSAG